MLAKAPSKRSEIPPNVEAAENRSFGNTTVAEDGGGGHGNIGNRAGADNITGGASGCTAPPGEMSACPAALGLAARHASHDLAPDVPGVGGAAACGGGGASATGGGGGAGAATGGGGGGGAAAGGPAEGAGSVTGTQPISARRVSAKMMAPLTCFTVLSFISEPTQAPTADKIHPHELDAPICGTSMPSTAAIASALSTASGAGRRDHAIALRHDVAGGAR